MSAHSALRNTPSPDGNALVALVLGGARSGKSAFAELEVSRTDLPAFYIATAEARDSEMAERIERHRMRRGADWTTIEEPLELAEALATWISPERAVLVDCLTLWLANLMAARRPIGEEVEVVCHVLREASGPVVLVSNEVGLGIVPDNALARQFRDEAGTMNRRIAATAGRVVFVAAGLPLTLKGPS